MDGEDFTEVAVAPTDGMSLDLAQELILEEHRIWKKNTPHLYDLCITQNVDWPSLTIEWLPTHDIPQSSDFSIQKLLVGTHTAPGEQNYIKVARVKIPLPDASLEGLQEKLNQEIKKEISSPDMEAKSTMAIQTIIAHDGDVNRARAMPQKPHIFATFSENSDVYVWDYTKHPTKPKTQESHPQLRLIGHSNEGYGLDWSTHNQGQLLTGAYDCNIFLWDVGAASALSNEMSPVQQYETGLRTLNEAKWHRFDSNIFASAHDGGQLAFWDSRTGEAMNTFVAHSADCITLDFNYHNPYLVASAGADNLVKVWDLRKPQTALMFLNGHKQAVQCVSFSPFYEAILASSGKDRKVAWWNLHDVVAESSSHEMPLTTTWKLDQPITPTGMIFLHSGHYADVPDIAWNKNDPMVMASTGEDNQIQVFTWNVHKYSSAFS